MRTSLGDPCRQLSTRESTVVATENKTVTLQQDYREPLPSPSPAFAEVTNWEGAIKRNHRAKAIHFKVQHLSAPGHLSSCLPEMNACSLLCSLRCLLVLFRVPPMRQYKMVVDRSWWKESLWFFGKSSRVPWWIFSFGLGDGNWGPSPWTSPKL